MCIRSKELAKMPKAKITVKNLAEKMASKCKRIDQIP